MFEERNNIDSDILMRSILENGQEEVPVHVWEGVSAGLDAIARRKKIALWWKRGAVATAVSAVAAAVAVVLFLNPSGSDMNIVPAAEDSNLIAVVEDVPAVSEEEMVAEKTERLTQKKEKVVEGKEIPEQKETEIIQETTEIIQETTELVKKTDDNTDTEVLIAETKPTEVKQILFQENWEEEVTDRKKIRTSLVLAGLTGTNNAQSNGSRSLVKRPSLSKEPLKSGVKETSTQSTYGIPLSIGAGVKIGFNPKWSISVGVNYSMLSRTFYGDYIKVADGVLESSISSDIHNVQHYIGIPVNAYYNILASNNINFYAYAGGTVEKCISNRYDVLSTYITHKENPAGVQLSANAGIGVEFMLGKHLGLYIDPSLRYYFDCNQPKSIRTSQPLNLGFEIGLRVNL